MRIAVFLAILFVAKVSAATPEAANEAYLEGVEHVRTGALVEARSAFERAYRESPHYLVLYNLGRVCHDLGDKQAARDYFRRFLDDGGERVPAERRAEVERLLAELGPDARAAAPVPAAIAPERAAAAESPSTPPATARHEAGRTPDAADAREARARNRAYAFAFGGTGVALVASGIAVWVWNDGRQDTWNAERAALEKNPPPEDVTTQEEIEEALAYYRAVGRSDAERDSLEEFDAVKWTLLGAGTALVATGLVFYLTLPSEPVVRVSGSSVDVSVAF